MTCQVSAILLAAGSSKRMGRLKQFLPLGDKPVIKHCLDNIIASGIKDIVVVLGIQGKELAKTINHLPVTIIFNNNPYSEMVESVRIGLQNIEPASSGILICLSDHPLVSGETLKTLITWHRREPDKIIVPLYNNKRGHPGLFPKQYAHEVFQGFTLREIVNKDPERIKFVEVSDEGILYDMDTQEDYRKISEIMNKKY